MSWRRLLIEGRACALVVALAVSALAAAPPELDDPEALVSGAVVRFTADTAPGVVATHLVPKLSWDWGHAAPDPRLPVDGFQLRASGSLLIQTAGRHTFAVRGDGDFLLKVNGQIVCDPAQSRTLDLKPGFVAWELTYQHKSGSARLAVDWSGPGFERELVPARLLYHDPKTEPALDRFEQGRRLADRLGCANCHQLLDLPRHPTLGPPLAESTRLIDEAWLHDWLRAPAKIHPRTPMPAFGAELNAEQAEDLIAFLRDAGGKTKSVAVSAELKMGLNVATPERGRLLFRSLGCLGCHGRGEPAGDEPSAAPDAGNVGLGRAREALAAFLVHQKTGKPAARHRPDLRLSTDDSAQLATYLATNSDPPKMTAVTRAGDAQRGRSLAAKLGCASCHEIPGLTAKPDRRSLHNGSHTDAGCLAEQPGNRIDVPRFDLSANARESLRAFIGGLPVDPSPTSAETLALDTIRRLNCLGCHARDAQGGDELAHRLAPILAEDRALAGLKGTLTPPNLTAVGAKLRAGVVASFFEGRAPTARPWLSVRMPTFALQADEAESIERAFRGQDEGLTADVSAAPAARLTLTPAERERGARLIGQRGFGCVSCHVIAGRIPPGGEPETLGPDLALASMRVAAPYFQRWLTDPQRVIPGTPMSQFLKPVEGVAGKLDDQFRDLWKLLHTDSLPAIVASGTREVLRRQGERALVVRDMVLVPELPDTKYVPRGLAIGLKNDVSLLFDADRLGWLAAWRGGFVSRTKEGRLWEWQPEGTRLVTASRRVPPLVLLDRDGSPLWPVETRERFGTFKALIFVEDEVRLEYRLDFATGSVEVHDRIRPVGHGWERLVYVVNVPPGMRPALVEIIPTKWVMDVPNRISWQTSEPDGVRMALRGNVSDAKSEKGMLIVPLNPAAAGGFGGGTWVEIEPVR
jgi:mono/diheme cytochrome c family protein